MDKPKFVYVTYISTKPEKLWNALRGGEMTRQYWGNRINASDWKVGLRWEHRTTMTQAWWTSSAPVRAFVRAL